MKGGTEQIKSKKPEGDIVALEFTGDTGFAIQTRNSSNIPDQVLTSSDAGATWTAAWTVRDGALKPGSGLYSIHADTKGTGVDRRLLRTGHRASVSIRGRRQESAPDNEGRGGHRPPDTGPHILAVAHQRLRSTPVSGVSARVDRLRLCCHARLPRRQAEQGKPD